MREGMKDNFEMDGHKLRWHLDRVEQWLQGDKIPPLHIDVGITTGCNLACTYCYGVLQGRVGFGTSNRKKFNMPKNAIVRLIEDARRIGIKSMAFIGEGENCLNPYLLDGFKAAKKVGLDISLATNGTILKGDQIPELLNPLRWLRVNISAASPESYEKIHGAPYFYKVIQNVKKLVEAKVKYGLNTTIGLQMVITKDNFDQILRLALLGKELGVDYSVFKPCSDTADKHLNSPDKEYLDLESIFREAEGLSSDSYQVIVKRIKLRNMGRKDFGKCFGTQFILGLSGNGNLFPCGHWFNIRSNEFLLGNVIDTSLEKIVQSEHYWSVQRKVSTEVNVNKDCETNCRQYYINQFLWDIQTKNISISNIRPCSDENKPQHINFI